MKQITIISLLTILSFSLLGSNHNNSGADDREYTANLAYKIAEPVLKNMAKGELKKNMQVELSPTWDGRNKDVTYMEAFGRLMCGIAPWLELPDDDTVEGVQRKQLREWALQSYAHAVDPDSPDYLLWNKENQPLVDAAFIAESFIRAPKQLWEPLDDITKQRYINEFTSLRRVNPPYNNWLLFSAIVESFLMSIDAPYDGYRISSALRKIEEWYVGDSWYADGNHFSFDYYGSFVIQPMNVEVIQLCVDKGRLANKSQLDKSIKRLTRHAHIQERFISPEGTFPVFGRSITYRAGALQVLSMAAWHEVLPNDVSEGQVRAGLTAVLKNMFSVEGNFNEAGFLQLGFAGHQPEIADVYTNNGSLYLTTTGLLHLGLPANHSFWTSEAQDWTSKKAWSGQSFSRDGASRD